MSREGGGGRVVVVQAIVVVVPVGIQRAASRVAAGCRATRWVAPAGGVALAALGLLAWSWSMGWLFAAAVAVPGGLAAHVDIRTQRLPDQLVLLVLAPTMAAAVAESLIGGALEALGAVMSGALALGAAPFVIHAFVPSSMGFGDVKMSLVLGAALGTWAPVLGVVALAAASLVAVAASAVLQRTSIAFGPALVLAFVVTAMLASPITMHLGGMSLGWRRW